MKIYISCHFIKIENYFSKYPKSKFITFDIEKDNVKKLEKT